jgi:hypothetical protein
MGLTWRATNSLTICSELRAGKSGEIEMRLVRLGQNGPGVSDPAFQLFMLTDASKHDTSFMCVRPASRYPNRRRRPGPSWSA